MRRRECNCKEQNNAFKGEGGVLSVRAGVACHNEWIIYNLYRGEIEKVYDYSTCRVGGEGLDPPPLPLHHPDPSPSPFQGLLGTAQGALETGQKHAGYNKRHRQRSSPFFGSAATQGIMGWRNSDRVFISDLALEGSPRSCPSPQQWYLCKRSLAARPRKAEGTLIGCSFLTWCWKVPSIPSESPTVIPA